MVEAVIENSFFAEHVSAKAAVHLCCCCIQNVFEIHFLVLIDIFVLLCLYYKRVKLSSIF